MAASSAFSASSYTRNRGELGEAYFTLLADCSTDRGENWHLPRMNDLLRFSGAVGRDPRIEASFSDFADPLRLMTQTCGSSACAATAMSANSSVSADRREDQGPE